MFGLQHKNCTIKAKKKNNNMETHVIWLIKYWKIIRHEFRMKNGRR